jgi:hypothetical protein
MEKEPNRKLNRDWILSNLKIANEQMTEIIKEIETNSDFNDGDFIGPISHLYQHINTVWNSRYESESAVMECTQEDHDKWGKLPIQDELYPF